MSVSQPPASMPDSSQERAEAPASTVPVPTMSGRLHVDGLQPVSPKLIPARYLGGLIGYAIGILAVIACIVAGIWLGWWWMHLIAVLPLIVVVQGVAFTPRRVRALGWREGEDELVIASGIMFRSLETVPFGRIQSVEISQGPVERHYGIATLEISTAGSASQTLPGLPRAEAERLRQRLIDRGISTMAAL
ncbi:PH domain-containing protein [Brachybacterium timonense]|uniref:PH domain-containing protein n=1 Tax=Brachybacterium timonense TaxID=2050896 RepID=UPI001FE5A85B|nr:PH domain-containing protein [Brachybacterium timonense]